jgi:hypothetical protein
MREDMPIFYRGLFIIHPINEAGRGFFDRCSLAR